MPPSLRQKSAVRQAQTAMETFYTDNQTYVGANVAALRDIEASLGTGAGTTLAVTGLSLTEYTLDVTSKTNHFSIAKATTGVVTRACTRPSTKGGCPASLTW